MLSKAENRGNGILESSATFSEYPQQNGMSLCNGIDDETSTGGSGSSRRDSSPFPNDPSSSTNNIAENFAFNDLKLELENVKNIATLNTIGGMCDDHIANFNQSSQGIDNIENIYNHLQKIKSKIDISVSILRCEKSLLDSPSPMSSNIEYISPKTKNEQKYSNSFTSSEFLQAPEANEAVNSDQEDSFSFLKLSSKQSAKGELQSSAIPIYSIDNDIRSQIHFNINRYNAFVNTFEFLSDLASIGISTVKLVKGDDVDEGERGLSPLVYLEPAYQDDSYYNDNQMELASKKRFVLRLKKESLDKSFLDSLPLKGKLKLRMKGDSEKTTSPEKSTRSEAVNESITRLEKSITHKKSITRLEKNLSNPVTFAPHSYSDILYLDTVNFTTALNLLPCEVQQVENVISLEISPFDVFLGTFPSFEHVEISVYLPYLPSGYSDVNYELWDTTSVGRVASFLSTRQKMINQILREEASAYERQVQLDRRRELLLEAKNRAGGWHDIFAWGCLPVRANDLPDQFVPLPAGYCHGDREFPYNNAAFLRSDVEGGEKKNDGGRRNAWMQSCYFNLTGAPLFWRNSAIMELAPRFKHIDHNKPRTRAERVRKTETLPPLSSSNIEESMNYPIEILNCRRGGRFAFYRYLYSLENIIRVGNTFNRDMDPLFTYYEKNISTVWTFSQVRTFIIKYLLYPKNFVKIASFIDSKSVGDCVDFYYKFKYKLRLKERLADVRLKIPGSSNSKSKQDIKRHQKRDYHLIDSLFSDHIPRDLYSPISWPSENLPQLDAIVSADALQKLNQLCLYSNYRMPHSKSIISNGLDWRRLYDPIYHLDNLREGYFLPTDIGSLFVTQPLVVPTSYLPTSPHALTLRGSIHLNKESKPQGSDCISFAVCHALATLAKLPHETIHSNNVKSSNIVESGTIRIVDEKTAQEKNLPEKSLLEKHLTSERQLTSEKLSRELPSREKHLTSEKLSRELPSREKHLTSERHLTREKHLTSEKPQIIGQYESLGDVMLEDSVIVDEGVSVGSTPSLMGYAWKLMDPIPMMPLISDKTASIPIGLSSRLLETIPITESSLRRDGNSDDSAAIYGLERLNISKP